MKRTILAFIIGVVLSIALFGGSRAPVVIIPKAVSAQTASTRSDWVSRERTYINDLINAASNIQKQDKEYVNNGYSSALVSGDIPTGLIVSDFTTAHGNAINIANGINNNGAVTVAAFTSATLYKIK